METKTRNSRRIDTAAPKLETEDEETRRLAEQFKEMFGERIISKAMQARPGRNEIKEIQRQARATLIAEDRRVFFLSTTSVAISVAWATVAATRKAGPCDFFFYAAGGLTGASFI